MDPLRFVNIKVNFQAWYELVLCYLANNMHVLFDKIQMIPEIYIILYKVCFEASSANIKSEQITTFKIVMLIPQLRVCMCVSVWTQNQLIAYVT